VTVIAPNVWRANSKLRENRFSNHSATLWSTCPRRRRKRA